MTVDTLGYSTRSYSWTLGIEIVTIELGNCVHPC